MNINNLLLNFSFYSDILLTSLAKTSLSICAQDIAKTPEWISLNSWAKEELNRSGSTLKSIIFDIF